MTPTDILNKLTKRSEPAYKANDVWLAQGYSLADLWMDLHKLDNAETHTEIDNACRKQKRAEMEARYRTYVSPADHLRGVHTDSG